MAAHYLAKAMMITYVFLIMASLIQSSGSAARKLSGVKAHMTINSFEKGGDGGGASECDQKFHKDSEMVVALSTGWYDKGSRCLKNIEIYANGGSVVAKVVDECDTHRGCRNNIVDASPAVWKALGIEGAQVGDLDVRWSDA